MVEAHSAISAWSIVSILIFQPLRTGCRGSLYLRKLSRETQTINIVPHLGKQKSASAEPLVFRSSSLTWTSNVLGPNVFFNFAANLAGSTSCTPISWFARVWCVPPGPCLFLLAGAIIDLEPYYSSRRTRWEERTLASQGGTRTTVRLWSGMVATLYKHRRGCPQVAVGCNRANYRDPGCWEPTHTGAGSGGNNNSQLRLSTGGRTHGPFSSAHQALTERMFRQIMSYIT